MQARGFSSEEAGTQMKWGRSCTVVIDLGKASAYPPLCEGSIQATPCEFGQSKSPVRLPEARVL